MPGKTRWCQRPPKPTCLRPRWGSTRQGRQSGAGDRQNRRVDARLGAPHAWQDGPALETTQADVFTLALGFHVPGKTRWRRRPPSRCAYARLGAPHAWGGALALETAQADVFTLALGFQVPGKTRWWQRPPKPTCLRSPWGPTRLGRQAGARDHPNRSVYARLEAPRASEDAPALESTQTDLFRLDLGLQVPGQTGWC